MVKSGVKLDQLAPPLPSLQGLWPKHGTHRLVKHLSEAPLGEGGALEVLDGAYLGAELLSLLPLDGGQALLLQLL